MEQIHPPIEDDEFCPEVQNEYQIRVFQIWCVTDFTHMDLEYAQYVLDVALKIQQGAIFNCSTQLYGIRSVGMHYQSATNTET